MKPLWKNTINAVSPLLLTLTLWSCGGKLPEDYADQWCELNNRIETSSDEAEKKQLINEMKTLENEIISTYEHDPETLKQLKKITSECD